MTILLISSNAYKFKMKKHGETFGKHKAPLYICEDHDISILSYL